MNLAQLVAARKKALGLSYKRMEEIARDSGYSVSSSQFHHYETGEITNIPSTDSLRGVAAALEVTPDDVLLAAAESIGLAREDYQRGERTAAMMAILASIQNRTPEQLAALESVMRSAVRLLDTGPVNDPGEID